MFFKILAKRFTVSLGKPGICSMAKKSYDIRVQVFHHTPWPPFSTHRPHRQRKKKWCRLLTWQCWNKKHQWTDRHIAKKVWHLIFIYIYIYIHIYIYIIIESYIVIYIYYNMNIHNKCWQPVQNSWCDHTWKYETAKEFPGIAYCLHLWSNECFGICIYVCNPCVYCCFPFWTELSQYAYLIRFVGLFLETATVTYYLQSILGNQRWYRPQPQPTDLYIENKSTIWMLIQMIGYDSTHIWYVELCRYIWKPEPQ